MDTVSHWAIVFGVLCVASWGWLQVRLFVLIADALMTACGCVFALALLADSSLAVACMAAVCVGVAIVVLHNLLVINMQLDEIIVGIAINLMCVGATKALVYWVAEATSINFGASQIEAISTFGSWLSAATVLSAGVFVYVIRYSSLWPMLAAVEQNAEWAREVGIRVLALKWVVLGCGAFIIVMDAMIRVTVNLGIAVDQWTDGIGFLAIGVAFFARTNVFALLCLSLLYSVPQALSTESSVRRVLGVHIADFLPVAIVLFSMLVIAIVVHLKERPSKIERDESNSSAVKVDT